MKTIRNVALMLALAAGAVPAQAQTPARRSPPPAIGQSPTRGSARRPGPCGSARRPSASGGGEASPDIYSREYRVAYARVCAPAQPEYQAEVQRQGGAGR